MFQTVSIGPDKEMKLLDFDYKTSSILELDELLGNSSDDIVRFIDAKNSLRQFWNKLETNCVAGCCGIDAFAFWPEDIAIAVEELGRKDLLEQLEQLRNRVVATNEQVVYYHRFNYLFAKQSFLELLDYLLTEVKK
ncbi:hypothetical protein GGR92_005118 [Spirosoma lacussanchae]|uniref:DUF6331 family protein n=1 Tax=Spirosoma lacussanchae TaxID=1884249 RepID=UPI0011096039|nr:DUF6331 family protein [Spirosoma lacussanchae]